MKPRTPDTAFKALPPLAAIHWGYPGARAVVIDGVEWCLFDNEEFAGVNIASNLGERPGATCRCFVNGRTRRVYIFTRAVDRRVSPEILEQQFRDSTLAKRGS